jgi:hypothetical protein
VPTKIQTQLELLLLGAVIFFDLMSYYCVEYVGQKAFGEKTPGQIFELSDFSKRKQFILRKKKFGRNMTKYELMGDKLPWQCAKQMS